MRKFFIYFVLLCLIIILSVIISFRFFPKLYVSAFNYFSEEQVTVGQIDISFVPLEVTIEKLGVSNSQKATIVNVEKTKLSAQVMAWFHDKQNFWAASVSNANVELINLPQSTNDSSQNSSFESKINIHKILSGLDLQIDGAQVQIDDKQKLQIERLYTSVNDSNLSNYKLIEQDVEFTVSYFGETQSNELPLTLSGFVQSRYVDGASVLTFSVPSIDLSSIVLTSDAEAGSEKVGSEKAGSEKSMDANTIGQVQGSVAEAVMDWQWLSSFEPLQIEAHVGEVLWSKSSLKNLDVATTLDQSILFSFQSDVAWLESDDISFEDTINFTGQWQPISLASVGADLRGESTLAMSGLNVKVAGDVNLNGVTGNKLLIELDGTKVPVNGLLDEQTQALVDQYFPVKTRFQVEPAGQVIELDISEAKFGNSDLTGQVSLNVNADGPLGVNAKLESKLFSYKSLNNGKELSDTKEIDQEKKTKKETVFNDDLIDWSWMDALLVDLDWAVGQLLIDEIEINELHLPLSISESGITISGFKALMAGGNILSDVSLLKEKEGVDIDVNLTASDIILEKLELLPPEELKGGVTDLSLALKTNGQSSRTLMQSLDGNILMNVGGGVIGNDSFELVGSDLIVGLLSKLNPFSKKDKTTKLECAVVNLNVEKGKINVDKSLALRTSKLTMVADGFVDLSSEKIKLGLTPKARQGVGVDVSSLAKFIALGGTLSKPKPVVTASGVLKSAVVVGAAVSTGGVSLLAASAAEKTIAKVDVCKRANNAFK